MSGLAEIAVGALTGWPFALAIANPTAARRIGIRSVHRLRQWHLDLIALGGLSTIASIAVPHRSTVTSVSLGIGAWTNAMGFGVLALAPELEKTSAYRTGIAVSFALTTVGFLGLARDGRRATSRRILNQNASHLSHS